MAHQQRVTIRLGARHHLASDAATRPRPVLDDHGLAERDLQFLRDLTGEYIGGTARREGHDQVDRLGRERVGARHARGENPGGKTDRAHAAARNCG